MAMSEEERRARDAANAREYRKQNKEKIAAKDKERKARERRLNPEKERARSARYRAENKEKDLLRHKKYRDDNKEKIAAQSAEYRARMNQEDPIGFVERQRAADRKSYYKNPEKRRAKRREQHAKNPSARAAAQQRYYEKNPGKRAEIDRRRRLKKFGLTEADYDSMLAAQNNVCGICFCKNQTEGKELAVDHDHASGKVRGLLCDLCNLMLGHSDDNVAILQQAVDYLAKFKHGTRPEIDVVAEILYKDSSKNKSRKSHLKRKYNMTQEDYEKMLTLQCGGCEICKDPQSEHRPLCIDHNHSTGQVRALLCTHCNSFIGEARESEEVLKSAIRYLGSHNETRLAC